MYSRTTRTLLKRTSVTRPRRRRACQHVHSFPTRTIPYCRRSLVAPFTPPGVRLVGPTQSGLPLWCRACHAVIGIGVVSALIVGRVAKGFAYSTLLTLLIMLIPLAAVLHYLESWLSHDLAYRLLAEMRVHMYEVLDRLAPAYLYRRRSEISSAW